MYAHRLAWNASWDIMFDRSDSSSNCMAVKSGWYISSGPNVWLEIVLL
jgi:hypothetical protein